MCGRFVLFASDDEVMTLPGFENIHAPAGLPPARYNIAPTHIIPILRAGDTPTEGVIEPARWGLIPAWKRDDTGTTALFNARAETVQTKPSFKDAFMFNRCAIPMSGYYEWKNKKPWWITTTELVWVAGLWLVHQGRITATMLTTAATPPLLDIHHRMPRFLRPEECHSWVFGPADQAASFLCPAPTGLVEKFQTAPANPAVGTVGNDYPELLLPPEEPENWELF